MEKVLQDIKNKNIGNAYLFYGEDSYKRRTYKDALKAALKSNDMNYSYFEGEGIDWLKVYDSAVSVPFFAGRRLIIVENSGVFKAASSKASPQKDTDILKILEDLPSSSCLAFFEEEALKTKKIFKKIKEKGTVLECGHDTPEAAAAWLKKGFSSAGKKIDNDAAYYLIDCVGVDYERLRMEFEKILAYCMDKDTVRKADVEAVAGRDIEGRVYELINACSEKNSSLMLKKYYALEENEVHPLIILASLRGQFKDLLEIGELSNKGFSDAETAKKMGKPEFVIRKNKKLLRNFSLKEIEGILEEITLTDKKIKDGDLNERTGVELLLIKISSKE